ncbi:MAG TPA: AAA family ATPase [Myxococcota bacterium]|nr:AAA family ATPase [Myxococcota bacterium]
MASPEIQRLRETLERALQGQDDAKAGLLLALVAREHAYLEGPPGCGKSALARALARASGARIAELAFHRDASAAELLGEVHLRREARASLERIAIELSVGPSASAEVLLLDDLSRAPGEALGVLLRVLGQRRLADRALPLETAIATSGPPELESYGDPLEPTQLDRFAIQVRMRGLLGARRFALARALLDRPLARDEPPPLDTEVRHALQRRAAALPIESSARAALLRAVERLAAAAGGEPALFSDRAFARAAPAVMRAHALLRGAERVLPEDVRALRYMLARRVPEALEPDVGAILEEAIQADSQNDSSSAGTRPAAADRTGAAPGPSGGAPSAALPVESLEARDTSLASIEPAAGARGDDDTAGVDPILRALAGRLERGAVDRGEDAGGSPRSLRRMRRLDEILDADPVDALLLIEGRQPSGARVFRRERRNTGGSIAVLRDVSASMEGRLARWAGQVVAGLVRVGARRRMRLGYIEFNHEAERFASGGAFFHRRYRRVLALAQRRRAEGRTNYEAPLRAALGELRASPGRERHIVLLSDGVPVLGDPNVRSERALARRLRVKVHTVFLGSGECPAVLDEISGETDGLRFEARPGPGGRLTLRERAQRMERAERD